MDRINEERHTTLKISIKGEIESVMMAMTISSRIGKIKVEVEMILCPQNNLIIAELQPIKTTAGLLAIKTSAEVKPQTIK
jgi:hypothetical protein